MSRIIGKISLYINYDVGFFARDISIMGSPKETQVPFKRMLNKRMLNKIIADVTEIVFDTSLDINWHIIS